MGKQFGRPLSKINKADKKLLAMSKLFEMREGVLQARAIYNLFDLLGDLGGLTEIVMLVFGSFLFPISEYSFIVEGMKRFFMASTMDDTLFLEENDPDENKLKSKHLNPENFPVDLTQERKSELSNHRHINLRIIDQVALYFANLMGVCFPCICWSKKEKLQRLFERSDDRIQKELDLIKVVRNMKSFKILLKNFLMTDKVKFEIAHSAKNCLDIDTESDEEEIDILD